MSLRDSGFRVVVAYDASADAELALERSVKIGSSSSELHVVSVLVDSVQREGEQQPATKADRVVLHKKARAAILNRLDALLAGQQASVRAVFVHVRVGEPATEILAVAQEAEADMILIGTQRRNSGPGKKLGSVAINVVRHGRCPVLVVRAKADGAVVWTSDGERPTCSSCVGRRRDTEGRQWWCLEHAAPDREPHIYLH